MEVRTAFDRSAISKGVLATIAAVVTALILGAVGGYFVKTVTLSVSVPGLAAHVVAAQPAASGFSSVSDYRPLHSGAQPVAEPAPSGLPAGASFREPTAGRSGPQS